MKKLLITLLCCVPLLVQAQQLKDWGKKQLKFVLAELDQLRKHLLKAVDQGGVVAVESEGCLITAYRLDSFNKSLANRKSI